MSEVLFWRAWHRSYRHLFYFFAAPLFVAIAFYIVSIGRGDKDVLHLEVETEASPIAVEVGHVQKGLFDFSISSDNYVLAQKFLGSDITINTTGIYLFFGLLVIALIFLLSIISCLKRFWYFGGMLAFVILLVELKTELLLFPAPHRQFLLAIMVISYLGVSFYFQAFNKGSSLNLRLLVFYTANSSFWPVNRFLLYGNFLSLFIPGS